MPIKSNNKWHWICHNINYYFNIVLCTQILKILKGGDEIEYCFNEHSENEENIDDEVYPNSSTELHLTLALLGVDEDSTSSSSSTDHSYSENLKDQWSSRSSSFN
jgi:diphthamide biosynthesis methyltransferase